MGRSRGTFILGTVASGIAAGIPRVARSACVPASCDVGVVGEPVTPDQWRSLAQPRALVLVGGVARGAYQAGVIDALHQAGYEFELICGTSIGAINGALVAQDDYQTLRTMWHSIASLHITEPKPVFEAAFRPQTRRYEPDAGLFNRTNAGVVTYTFFGVIQSIASGGASQIAVFNNANSNAVIEANVNLDRVRKPFAYVATNLDLQQPEAFFVDPERASDSYGPRMADRLSNYTRSVDMPLHQLRRTGSKADAELYWKSVRASGAFPIAFDPIKLSVADSLGAVQEYSYVDGGITANTPLSLAYELSAANILTVFVDPPTRLAPPKKALSLEDLANDVIGTLQERQITKDVYFIEQTKDAPNLFEIRPRCTLEVGVFGFDDQCNIDLAYNRGLADGTIGPIAAKTFRSQRKPY